jgi:hypothetical protein
MAVATVSFLESTKYAFGVSGYIRTGREPPVTSDQLRGLASVWVNFPIFRAGGGARLI